MKILIKLLPMILLLGAGSLAIAKPLTDSPLELKNRCSISHYPVNQGKVKRYIEFSKGSSKERVVTQSLKEDGTDLRETITYPNEVTIIRRNLECVSEGIRMMDLGNLLAGSHTQLRVINVSGLSLKKGEWRVGDRWQTVHRLTGTNNPLINTLSINGTATSNTEVISLNETVKVVGGTFKASRVRVVTKVRFLADKESSNNKSTPRNLPINATSSHWYAPGIGLIKSVVKSTFGDTKLEYLGEKDSTNSTKIGARKINKKGYPLKTLPGLGNVATKPDKQTICIIPAETNLVNASEKPKASKAIYLAFENMLRPVSYKTIDLGYENAYRAKEFATRIGCHYTMNLELKRVRDDVAKLVSKAIDDSEKVLARSSTGYVIGSSPGYSDASLNLSLFQPVIANEDIFSIQLEITNAKGKRIMKSSGFSKARFSGDSKLTPLVEKMVREIRRGVFKETFKK